MLNVQSEYMYIYTNLWNNTGQALSTIMLSISINARTEYKLYELQGVSSDVSDARARGICVYDSSCLHSCLFIAPFYTDPI